MVVMTGDAPMGFIATTLPKEIPVLRIDGWFLQPRDGTRLTRDMMRRVNAHLRGGGDLYLMADATDMGRARDALSRLSPGHPLARMPAIRYKHPRHLPMVPARQEELITP